MKYSVPIPWQSLSSKVVWSLTRFLSSLRMSDGDGS